MGSIAWQEPTEATGAPAQRSLAESATAAHLCQWTALVGSEGGLEREIERRREAWRTALAEVWAGRQDWPAPGAYVVECDTCHKPAAWEECVTDGDGEVCCPKCRDARYEGED